MRKYPLETFPADVYSITRGLKVGLSPNTHPHFVNSSTRGLKVGLSPNIHQNFVYNSTRGRKVGLSPNPHTYFVYSNTRGLKVCSKMVTFLFSAYCGGHFCYHINVESRINTRILHFDYCFNKLIRRTVKINFYLLAS